MAEETKHPGRRVSVEPHLYEPGDYGKWDNRWFALTPGEGKLLADLSGHHVEEHHDGTITVSPSIRSWDHESMWHGYLERGQWREVKD